MDLLERYWKRGRNVYLILPRYESALVTSCDAIGVDRSTSFDKGVTATRGISHLRLVKFTFGQVYANLRLVKTTTAFVFCVNQIFIDFHQAFIKKFQRKYNLQY